MAEIHRIPWFRHLRAETTSHVLAYRGGRLKRSGRGLAFWFFPMSAAIAEVPIDDRDLMFLFHGRTRDYQDIATQGVITYRVVDAEKLAERIDFSIDLYEGTHRKQPLEQLSALLTGLAQQAGLQHIARSKIHELLTDGFDVIKARIESTLLEERSLEELGIWIASCSSPRTRWWWWVRTGWSRICPNTSMASPSLA